MGVCEKKKKKVKMRQRERKRERGREDLFNREDWGGACFFFLFQERDDRWKERLRREKSRKKETKGVDIKMKRRSYKSE